MTYRAAIGPGVPVSRRSLQRRAYDRKSLGISQHIDVVIVACVDVDVVHVALHAVRKQKPTQT